MKPKIFRPIDGVLLADKPQGWTSHDVCAFIRRRFQIKKVGHAGTLDPLATGLLVVLLGKATKLSMPLSDCEKEYFGTMKLGTMTDSHDASGKVLGEKAWKHVALEMVREHARQFSGEIMQTPPMVSALKHKGVRLYKLARQGKTVPREERRVVVHDLSIESKEADLVSFSTKVSKGTYVRTLVHDLGLSLGCYAMLASLRRSQAGDFSLKNAYTIEQLKKTSPDDLRPLITPLHALSVYAHSGRP